MFKDLDKLNKTTSEANHQ